MTDRLKALVDEILSLSPSERRQFESRLASETARYEVRDGGASYINPSNELITMKWVTVVLPDDLAMEAQAAGVLADKTIEELIRRELSDRSRSVERGASRRKIVRHDGRLVVEVLPGEKPITDAEVKDHLDKLEG